jgi:hypothetical protein
VRGRPAVLVSSQHSSFRRINVFGLMIQQKLYG